MYSGGGDVYDGFGFWGACLVFRFDCISHIKLKKSVTCECCDK